MHNKEYWEPSQEWINKVLDKYSYTESGLILNKLTNKILKCRTATGHPPYSRTKQGYARHTIAGHLVMAHRIIWLLHTKAWPSGVEVDHINGIRHDNRIENLRLVTILGQAQNKYIHKKPGCFVGLQKNKQRSYINLRYKPPLTTENKNKPRGYLQLNNNEEVRAIKACVRIFKVDNSSDLRIFLNKFRENRRIDVI
jgi:hypothetical protein